MKKSGSTEGQSASELIDKRIAELVQNQNAPCDVLVVHSPE